MKIREPYTRTEIEEIYAEQIEATAKQWGANDYYTKRAREYAKERLEKFDNGEIVEVYNDSYHKDGMDWTDCFYSDGTKGTMCFGYID